MAIQIRFNSQRAQLVSWPPRHGEGPSWLHDKVSLREAIQELVADSEGSTELRGLLRDIGAHAPPTMPDDELTDLAVGLIEEGRLMILPPEWRWRPRLLASTPPSPPPTPIDPPPPPAPTQKTFIAIKIVDEKTGDPVSSVRLKLTLPDGVEDYYTTNASGVVRVDNLPPGTCDAACDLTGATMEDTYEFKGEGEPPKPGPKDKVWPSRRISASNLKRIAEIERHKVKDGESIDSLAKANGFDWKFLSRFNWGTDVPREINKHLVDDNGIWKPTKDGRNFVFTSTDHPGIMFIPKKWEKTGLATGKEHVFKVRHIAPLVVRLETVEGHRIPEADYEITWANEDTKQGTLGPQGIDMIEDPPPGEFTIEYKDLHLVLAKGLAAQARKAMDKRDKVVLLEVLKYDKETAANVVTFYDKYFNTYSGRGFIEDLYAQFPDEDERMVLEYLLAHGEQEVKSGAELVEQEPDSALPAETDEAFGKVGALEGQGGGGG